MIPKIKICKIILHGIILAFILLIQIKVYAIRKEIYQCESSNKNKKFESETSKKIYEDTLHLFVVDTSHYSTVFGEVRSYRVYLPPSYYNKSYKYFPVIYFFHGWSQRYFGPVGEEYGNFDSGEDNGGDNIESFIKKNEVIIVKMDGYDRSLNEKYYVRPYSIGPVEKSYRQFPIYFPELVNHVDENFRTVPDRNHRAVSGLSMGGFMAFWIAGKYPQLISAAGNFCGSTEFEVGPKDFTAEYRHLDMYKNYAATNVRLNFGNKDFVRSYHEDLNRSWTNVMEHYYYKEYNALHSTCGLEDMFSFIMNSFKKPPLMPVKWDHIDVYPDFEVWDYKISSDRNMPGFTIIENVDKNGFKISVRKFLPDGVLMQDVKLNVLTKGIYKKNKNYILNDIDLSNGKIEKHIIKSNNEGKLKIMLNGSTHHIAVNCKTDKPNLVLASFKVTNPEWAIANKKLIISITLLNKGFGTANNVNVKISSPNKDVAFLKSVVNFKTIKSNEILDPANPFEIIIKDSIADVVKFKLLLSDDKGNSWTECFELSVKKETNVNPDFAIADGRAFTVSKAGLDSQTVFLGMGNGDGIANPGESIVILIKDKNLYRRTYLFSSDKFVNALGENARESDNWAKYDFGGASSKYSIPIISSNCPEGHIISFHAEYWIPDKKPYHLIRGSRIEVTVTGVDKTSPLLIWGNISANNTIKVKLSDGSAIQNVKATFMPFFDDINDSFTPEMKSQIKTFTVELNDSAVNGDIYASDNVSSCTIPKSIFCAYKVVIESTDSHGNRNSEQLKEILFVY